MLSTDSPAALIRGLPRPAFQPAQRALAASMLGVGESELAATFEMILNGTFDPAAAALGAVIDRLPAAARAQLTNPEALGVATSDFQFNASAIPCDNGGWAIILDRRLMAYYFAIVQVLAHRVEISDSDGEPLLGLADAAHIVGDMTASVHARGLPLVKEFRTDVARTHLASDLTTQAYQFVLSHELSHIVLGHTGAANYFAAILRNQRVTVAEWSWDQEWEADRLALGLALGPPPGPPAWEELAMRYAGCHIALDVLAFIDDYAAEVLHITEIATHPPSAGRMARLRAIAEEACADDDARRVMFGWADEIARMLDEIRIELGMFPSASQA